MNTLEQLITFDEINLEETAFSNGVYINLRHNTDDTDEIISSFERIYRVLFQTIKGVKPVLEHVYRTPRIPVENRVDECLSKGNPVMVSSVERKHELHRYQTFSHHLLYGAHQYYRLKSEDESMVNNISNALLNNIPTIDNSESNILIQPVGASEDQQNDRFSREEYYKYISNPLNDDGKDTLLTYMIKSSPKMSYSLHYSYHK